jgi:hypothetical protein
MTGVDSEEWFADDDIVSQYTSAQAEDDGILVDIGAYDRGARIQYATRGLLALGYLEDVPQARGPPAQRLRASNLADLVTQAVAIIRRASVSTNFEK